MSEKKALGFRGVSSFLSGGKKYCNPLPPFTDASVIDMMSWLPQVLELLKIRSKTSIRLNTPTDWIGAKIVLTKQKSCYPQHSVCRQTLPQHKE